MKSKAEAELTVQIYPYHLADYIARIMRVTSFRYNCDLLYSALRDEKSYDFLPNFTVSVRTSNLSCLSSLTLLHIRISFHSFWSRIRGGRLCCLPYTFQTTNTFNETDFPSLHCTLSMQEPLLQQVKFPEVRQHHDYAF